MRSHIRTLTLASLLTLGCGLLSSATVAFASSSAVVTLDRSLSAPASTLPPLVNRAQGIELHSCDDLIAAIGAGKDLREITELPQFNACVDCMAVTLVAEDRGARDARFDVRHAGERISRDLDLASVASSLAPRRPAPHYRVTDAIDVLTAGKQRR